MIGDRAIAGLQGVRLVEQGQCAGGILLLELRPSQRVGDIGRVGRQLVGLCQHSERPLGIAILDQPSQIVQRHGIVGFLLKRAEIARALVVKPEILYMDEPFSALDALMSLRMQNELLRILGVEKHTVMLITHDVEEAIHLADRILVLSPRPARIQASFDVPFPHPRRVSSPEAQALRVAILKELGVTESV